MTNKNKIMVFTQSLAQERTMRNVLTHHGYTGVPCAIFTTSEKKPQMSHLVRTTRFWNNLHQTRSNPKDSKVKHFKVFESNKTKGPKQESKNQVRSPMFNGREHLL